MILDPKHVSWVILENDYLFLAMCFQISQRLSQWYLAPYRLEQMDIVYLIKRMLYVVLYFWPPYYE